MTIKNLPTLICVVISGLVLVPAVSVFAQPVSDNCANAITLTVNATCTSDVTNAGTLETGELTTCLGTGIDQTVWYKFVATQADMDVIILGNSANTCYFGSAIWDPTTSPCPVTTGTALSCEDKSGGPLSQKHVLSGLVVSNVYLIQIGYNSGASCGSSVSFCVTVFDNEVSADNCADAVNASTYAEYTVSNVGSTADGDLCSGSTENNIWFKWVVPSWWTPGASAYVHLYGQDCDRSAGMQLSIYEKDNCFQIPNPALGGSPPGSYGDCVFWANTQSTNDIDYDWVANPGDILYFNLDGFGGTSCIFTFMVSPYACFTATATTTTEAPCPPATGGTATVIPTGVNPPFTYLWDVPAGSQTVATATGLTANTTYYVTVTDNASCAVITSATVPGPAVAGYTTGGDFCTTGTGGTGVIFTNTGTSAADGATFSWTFPSGTPATSTAENPTVTWAANATYSVSQDVTKDGCTQTSTQDVTILDCTCPLIVTAGTDLVVCDNATISLAGSFSSATVSPTYLIDDDFESYASQAAFEASGWTFPFVGSSEPTLTTDEASSPTQSISLYRDGAYHAFTTQTVFTVEFDVYVTGNSQAGIAVTNGASSAATTAVDVRWADGSLYYASGGLLYSVGLMSQNAWHTIKFDISTSTNTYDIYLDGSLVRSAAPFYAAQSGLNRIYLPAYVSTSSTYYIDDVKVYYYPVTILWTVSPACSGCLTSTSELDPVFSPPIVSSQTVYTFTLCIVDDCSGACPNSTTDDVTVTVNHCCDLILDGASNDNNNDSTFNMCSQPTLVLAGAATNPFNLCAAETLITVDFDACSAGLPGGWATNVVAGGCDWTFNNTTFNPANTVNGSCAAFFDDDACGSGELDNTSELFTTAVDNSCHTTATVEFDYRQVNFVDMGTPYGLFTVDVWDGSAWQNILTNNATIATTTVTTDVTAFKNADFQVRFTYDDEDNWTFGVGVDNVYVFGVAPAVAPTIAWSPASDLSSTTVLTPTFTPTAAGNYFYSLSYTDNCGNATDDMLITITDNDCTTGFSVNSTSQDLGSYPVAPYNTFNFLNTGSTGNPVYSYSWDMGDGGAGVYLNSTSSTSENPDYSYATDGTYTVEQTITIAAEGACASDVCTTTLDVTVTLPPCTDATRVYYESRATGDWDAIATWNFSCDANVSDPWTPATGAYLPDYAKKTIWIRSGHIVTITADVTVDEVIIDAGGTLKYDGGTLTINNGTGADFVINGTFEDNGPNDIAW